MSVGVFTTPLPRNIVVQKDISGILNWEIVANNNPHYYWKSDLLIYIMTEWVKMREYFHKRNV